MLKGVHESLQGGWIGDVCLARPHFWQLLHLPCDLRQHLHHRIVTSALKIEKAESACQSKMETRNPALEKSSLFRLYLSAVGEKLVQLMRRRQHLPAGFHQLKEVRPRLVQPVLPLGDGGSVGVAAVDHLVHHLVNLLHALLASAVGF